LAELDRFRVQSLRLLLAELDRFRVQSLRLLLALAFIRLWGDRDAVVCENMQRSVITNSSIFLIADSAETQGLQGGYRELFSKHQLEYIYTLMHTHITYTHTRAHALTLPHTCASSCSSSSCSSSSFFLSFFLFFSFSSSSSSSQGFKVLLSFLPLGARKLSYIRTRHSL